MSTTKSNSLVHPFVHLMYLRMSIQSALGRGNVYSGTATPEDRIAFKQTCAEKLTQLGNRYFAWEYDLDRYIEEITSLCDSLSSLHGPILDQGRFRIGTAQKMISLYLKYLWLGGDSAKKPLCAVLDRGVLALSGYPNPPLFTELDDAQIYRDIQIHIAKKCEPSQHGSPAVWEVDAWNNSDLEEEDL